MYRIIFLFFILCSSGILSGAVASAEPKEGYIYCLDQSRAALSRNEYLKAIDYLKRAHRASPSSKYPLEKIKAIQDLIRNHSRYNDAQRQLRLYTKYTQMGKGAFDRGDYKKASYYFHYAGLMVPDGKESGQYINLIKRMDDGRVVQETGVTSKKQNSSSPAQKSNDRKVVERDLSKGSAVDSKNQLTNYASPKIKKLIPSKKASTPSERLSAKTLPLDDALWASQPKTQIQIEHGSYLIIESRDIDRFLTITPGILDIERLDRDHLKITPIHIGTTFVHVWDQRGRWTFHVRIIFPVQAFDHKPQVPSEERYADPFKFTYALDGGALYRGNTFPSSKRETLNMQQVLAVKGETPYGVADGSVGYYKFEQSTEATNYTVGLSGIKGAGFTGVNVRGYDAVKYFSALTFPGQYFRGFLIEGKALGENIAATYLHGQDRFTYSYVSPGVVEDRRSYVEGARVTLFPNDDNQYSVNYARGYGDARQTYLKNEVYSVEAQHRFDLMLLKGEVATNKDTLAETLSSKIGSEGRLIYAHFRDIDNDFTTITGLPSNRGEIGANVGMDLDYDLWGINSNLDFYRDRFLPNQNDPDAVNYDLNSSVNFIIDDTTGFSSTAYYLDTPGELSPRQNFRWMNNLSKRYKIIGDRDLQTFVGASYNRNRVKDTPISEYDRYAATAGFQVGLISHLRYFANYEYSWVNELLSANYSYPSVFNTGLNYARELTRKTSTNIGFYYRDEQNSGGTNSFLAGEDSITGSLALSYRPTNSSELFVDSRVRNVWRENPDNSAYNEIDVRWGLRSSWDLPMIWNPSGIIYGVVYKDLNSDGQKDPGEPGIADVHIRVGKKEAITNSYGRYKTKVRAKEVLVSADSSTVTTGYVLSTPAIYEITVPYKKSVDFGFTVQSGIYGIVYYDRNGDNQPDEGDEFIQKARILLDDTVTEISDYDGTYFFKNVSNGKHTLRIDVNSLPMEYLPLIRLVNPIEVAEGSTYVFHVPLKKKSSDED